MIIMGIWILHNIIELILLMLLGKYINNIKKDIIKTRMSYGNK